MSESPSDSISPKSNRKALAPVLLTLFIDLVGFSIVFPLFPAMLDFYLEREGTTGLLGLVLKMAEGVGTFAGNDHAFTPVLFGGILGSLYSLLQFALAPLWGAISDRMGRRRVLLITIAGTALSYLVWVFAGSFWILVVARFIGGAMSGNISVCTAAVADLSDRKNRAKAMGMVGAVFGLGFILGPAFGALFALINPIELFPALESIALHPFSVAAFFAFALSMVNLVMLYRSFPETLSVETREKADPLSAYNPLKTMFAASEGGVRRASFLNFFFMVSFSGMEFTLSFLGVDRFGFQIHDITWMMVFVGFMLILVQGGLIRRIVPKFGEKKLIVSGVLLVAVGLWLLSSAQSVAALYGALAVMSLGAGIVTPCLSAAISIYSKEESQGKAMGSFRAWGSLARAIGPLLAGFVFWWAGSASAYIFGAALMLIPFVFGITLPAPDKEN